MVVPFMLGHTTMSEFPTVMPLTADIATELMGFTAGTAIARAIIHIVRVITAIDIVRVITAEAGGATTGPVIGEDAVGKVMVGRAVVGKDKDRAGAVRGRRDGSSEVRAHRDAAFEVRVRVEA